MWLSSKKARQEKPFSNTKHLFFFFWLCRSLHQTNPLLKRHFPRVVHYARPTGVSLNAEESGTKTYTLTFLLIRHFFGETAKN